MNFEIDDSNKRRVQEVAECYDITPDQLINNILDFTLNLEFQSAYDLSLYCKEQFNQVSDVYNATRPCDQRTMLLIERARYGFMKDLLSAKDTKEKREAEFKKLRKEYQKLLNGTASDRDKWHLKVMCLFYYGEYYGEEYFTKKLLQQAAVSYEEIEKVERTIYDAV